MRIGVLALQGDFAAHRRMLTGIGVESADVRCVADLESIDGLIIPGGESTTMLKFLNDERLAEPIKSFAGAGKPIFGTCAGAILLAREVTSPAQASLGLIDMTVVRNAYGRQVDSFIGTAEIQSDRRPLEAVFIRAPRFLQLGPGVETLARIDGDPVLVREGNVMAATFHPELTTDERVHRLFLRLANYNPTETDDEALQMGRN